MQYFIVLLIVLGLCAGSAYEGHGVGVNSQKAADQKQFDDINKKLADQQTIANQKYRDAAASALLIVTDRDRLKNQLGVEYVKNQDITNKLRNSIDAYGLRFRTETARCGDRYGCADTPAGDTASNEKTAIVELPADVTRNLRQLAFDADELKDDYQLCYSYTHP